MDHTVSYIADYIGWHLESSTFTCFLIMLQHHGLVDGDGSTRKGGFNPGFLSTHRAYQVFPRPSFSWIAQTYNTSDVFTTVELGEIVARYTTVTDNGTIVEKCTNEVCMLLYSQIRKR